MTPLFSPVYNIYVKNWKKIEITNIQAWDGKDYGTRPDHTIITRYEKGLQDRSQEASESHKHYGINSS